MYYFQAARAGCPSCRSSGVAPSTSRIDASEAGGRRERVGDGASAIRSFILTASLIYRCGEFPPTLIPYIVFCVSPLLFPHHHNATVLAYQFIFLAIVLLEDRLARTHLLHLFFSSITMVVV
jgi:hypothetical protein